ncbi:hypothetical protein ACIRPP_31075 [Streptomyces sp. NPDC101219]
MATNRTAKSVATQPVLVLRDERDELAVHGQLVTEGHRRLRATAVDEVGR